MSWSLRSLAAGSLLLMGCSATRAGEVTAPGKAPHPPQALVQREVHPLTTYECSAAFSELRERAIAQIRSDLENEFDEWKSRKCGEGERPAPRDASRANRKARRGGRSLKLRKSSGRKSQSSSTHLLVDGVDEADRVKSDGRNLAVVSAGKLHLFEIATPVDDGPLLKHLSSIAVGERADALFFHDDRAVVLAKTRSRSKSWCVEEEGCNEDEGRLLSTISIFDLADQKQPRLARRLELSGEILEARRIENRLHWIVRDRPRLSAGPARLSLPGCFVPDDEERLRGELERVIQEHEAELQKTFWTGASAENGHLQSVCQGSIHLPDKKAPEELVTLMSLSLEGRFSRLQTDSFGVPIRFAHFDQERVFLFGSGTFHSASLQQSCLSSRYEASGAYGGRIIGPSSVNTYNGQLRVVSEDSDLHGNSFTNLDVFSPLGNRWRLSGRLTDLGHGESLRAVQFEKERAFVVTFLNQDPLYALDLSNPDAPSIANKLEIPGYSTFLHQLNRRHLLSVGYDTWETGAPRGVLLQLFDVGEQQGTRVLHELRLGDTGSDTATANDHRAFAFDEASGILALPTRICDGGRFPEFEGTIVIHVDPRYGFRELGRFGHSASTRACSQRFETTSRHGRSVIMPGATISLAKNSLVAAPWDFEASRIQRHWFRLDVND